MPLAGKTNGQFVSRYPTESCVPKEVFIAVLVAIMGILVLAITIAVCLYIKLQRVSLICEKQKQHILPEIVAPHYILTPVDDECECFPPVEREPSSPGEHQMLASDHTEENEAHANALSSCEAVQVVQGDGTHM